jgi:hypothetical protein
VNLRWKWILKVLVAAGLGSFGALVNAGGLAGASPGSGTANTGHDLSVRVGDDPSPAFRVSSILAGTSLHHEFTPASSTARQSEALANPDDITRLGNDLFVGFQNGVGPQGQPSTDGNPDSTIVELNLAGHEVEQWDIAGKADGVSADPIADTVIATVNEDAKSALYTIQPDAPSAADQVTRYAYHGALPHGGGTDAISIYGGHILISASAPGTNGAPAPQPTYPAVYSVTLDPRTQVATVTALFDDEDSAIVANVNSPQLGQSVQLALTDPDSNEVVPFDGPRFAGDFMLTSQGDEEQIYVSGAGGPHQRLAILSLSQAVDDTAWPTGFFGRLYSTDSANDTVDVVTGPFRNDQPIVVATPCGSNSAPATCPAPPSFPANYLGSMNPWTGRVTALPIQGPAYVPQGGLVFVPSPSW